MHSPAFNFVKMAWVAGLGRTLLPRGREQLHGLVEAANGAGEERRDGRGEGAHIQWC